MGFKHGKITPLLSKANWLIKRLNENCQESSESGIAQSLNWIQELRNFLLAYHATWHSTTAEAPATLLFDTTIKSKIPEINSYYNNGPKFANIKMKDYHNQKSKVQASILKAVTS